MLPKYDFKHMVETHKAFHNPNKIYRILSSNGIRNWRDIMFMSVDDISAIKGIGKGTAEELYWMARKEESMNPEKYFKSSIDLVDQKTGRVFSEKEKRDYISKHPERFHND